MKSTRVRRVKGWAVYDPYKNRITGAFVSKEDLHEAMYLEEQDKILTCTITYPSLRNKSMTYCDKSVLAPTCGNPDCNCPCHTPTPNTDREQKIEAGAKDFAERFEGVMKDLAEEDSPQVTGGMEEELKKTVFYNQLSASSQAACAHFFHSALTHDRARLVEEVNRMRKAETREVRKSGDWDLAIGWNAALDTVLTLLKDKGVE